mmetsp:Transcript_28928/g.81212  ORF Transcript_28928/g.81212 Transcript_28928/m.81212 type:complete len:239 (+) Transcript_28928:801-1517(+)
MSATQIVTSPSVRANRNSDTNALMVRWKAEANKSSPTDAEIAAARYNIADVRTILRIPAGTPTASPLQNKKKHAASSVMKPLNRRTRAPQAKSCTVPDDASSVLNNEASQPLASCCHSSDESATKIASSRMPGPAFAKWSPAGNNCRRNLRTALGPLMKCLKGIQGTRREGGVGFQDLAASGRKRALSRICRRPNCPKTTCCACGGETRTVPQDSNESANHSRAAESGTNERVATMTA